MSARCYVKLELLNYAKTIPVVGEIIRRCAPQTFPEKPPRFLGGEFPERKA